MTLQFYVFPIHFPTLLKPDESKRPPTYTHFLPVVGMPSPPQWRSRSWTSTPTTVNIYATARAIDPIVPKQSLLKGDLQALA